MSTCSSYRYVPHAHIAECLSLSNFTIHSCILHSGTADFISCEKLPHTHSEHSYQIVARRQIANKNDSFVLAESRIILTHAPPLQPLGFQDGVCFIPSKAPYPDGLLVFWGYIEATRSDVLKPFVWNCTSTLPDFNLLSGCETLSFRTLAQQLAGTWSKVYTNSHLVESL